MNPNSPEELLEASGPEAIVRGEKTIDPRRLERVRVGALRRIERSKRRPSRRVGIVLLAAALVLVGALAAAMLEGALSKAPPPPIRSAAQPPTALAVGATAAVSTNASPPTVSVDDLPASSSTVAAVPRGQSASEIFAQANASRQTGNLVDAVASYRRLERAFPTSDEAAVARVSLGRILLDQGNATEALHEFDAYLADATHSALREDSLVGRARALGALGRHDDERTAWKALLDAYPDSLTAGRARKRLEELR